MSVKLLTRMDCHSAFGQPIVINLPHIKQDIPIVIVFRALGCVTDQDILQHIAMDSNDDELMKWFVPSLQKAINIQDQNAALNFIGSRVVRPGVTREERIEYAREMLRKELLPHVSVSDFYEMKKCYFLGYLINRLFLVSMARRDVDSQ